MEARYQRISPVKAELTSICVGNALVRACVVYLQGQTNASYSVRLLVSRRKKVLDDLVCMC